MYCKSPRSSLCSEWIEVGVLYSEAFIAEYEDGTDELRCALGCLYVFEVLSSLDKLSVSGAPMDMLKFSKVVQQVLARVREDAMRGMVSVFNCRTLICSG